MQTITDFYIARNQKVIESFNKHTIKMTVREAFKAVGEEVGISKHTVRRIVYDPAYAHGRVTKNNSIKNNPK